MLGAKETVNLSLISTIYLLNIYFVDDRFLGQMTPKNIQIFGDTNQEREDLSPKTLVFEKWDIFSRCGGQSSCRTRTEFFNPPEKIDMSAFPFSSNDSLAFPNRYFLVSVRSKKSKLLQAIENRAEYSSH